ncbi:MAG TPA: hypothetical protein VGM56_13710 [Byssovorax sp.]
MTSIRSAAHVARDALLGLHHRRVRLRRAPRVVAALAGLVGSARSILDVGAHDGRVALALGAAVDAALKDHFRFGRASELMLLALDRVGNAGPAVAVRGTYLSPREWTELVDATGGRFRGLGWPLQVHDEPIRRITRDELQFAARVERRGVA